MNTLSLQLSIMDERMAVCQCGPEASLPGWATQGRFFSITRTRDELSIVCPEAVVPEGVKAVKGWNWRTMRRNPVVYVRGSVRHADYKTIVLHDWHRVLMNTEGQSRAMRNVAFLD